jgi:hypothetical protein
MLGRMKMSMGWGVGPAQLYSLERTPSTDAISRRTSFDSYGATFSRMREKG